MKRTHGKECDWVLETMESWLDGDLEPADAARFQRHVAGCDACRSEAGRAREVTEALRSLPMRECPPEVVERAAAAARAGKTPLRDRIAGWLGPRVEIFLRPAMVAMLLVVVAAGVFVIANRGRVSGPQSPYTQAEIEEAAAQARLAFAYVGYYSRRAGRVISDEVMAQRVVPDVEDALARSGREVIDETIVPSVEEAVLQALFVETIPRMNPSKDARRPE